MRQQDAQQHASSIHRTTRYVELWRVCGDCISHVGDYPSVPAARLHVAGNGSWHFTDAEGYCFLRLEAGDN